jgi:uncharacterized protein DUF2550
VAAPWTTALDVGLEILGAALFLLVALLGAFAFRRWLFQRWAATFDCAARMCAGERARETGWMLGVGAYTSGSVSWYRAYSLSLRPWLTVSRGDVTVVLTREASIAETEALLADVVVVECMLHGETIELAMAEPSLTGFLAWLEAAPPGQNVGVA